MYCFPNNVWVSSHINNKSLNTAGKTNAFLTTSAPSFPRPLNVNQKCGIRKTYMCVTAQDEFFTKKYCLPHSSSSHAPPLTALLTRMHTSCVEAAINASAYTRTIVLFRSRLFITYVEQLRSSLPSTRFVAKCRSPPSCFSSFVVVHLSLLVRSILRRRRSCVDHLGRCPASFRNVEQFKPVPPTDGYLKIDLNQLEPEMSLCLSVAPADCSSAEINPSQEHESKHLLGVLGPTE